MEMEFKKFKYEPYGHRLGYAYITINQKLDYLFVVAKDKQTGDVKAFPPSQKVEEGFIPCFIIPQEVKEQAVKLVVKTVKEQHDIS